MLVGMKSNRNTHFLLVARQSDTVTLEDSLAVFCKTKHTLVVEFNSCFSWYLFKEVKKCMSITKAAYSFILLYYIYIYKILLYYYLFIIAQTGSTQDVLQ
jgi:hypothetical protein